MSTVIVIGGGVAGLSAAHMLVRRGFDVEVYERGASFGGKARSFRVRENLPCEHGFRFFPGFYRHLPATMQEIPLRGGEGTVYENLIPALVVGITQVEKPSVWIPTRFPASWAEWKSVFHLLAYWRDLGITSRELRTFAFKLLNIAQMCHERRFAELEGLPWMDYLEADRFSPEYRKLFARGLTRSLVALQADQGSTRTVGNVTIQLLRYMVRRGHAGDRLLNGPTSEAWFEPWVRYLESPPAGMEFPNGATVRLHTNATALDLVLADGRIREATVWVGPQERKVSGDYFILSVPVDEAERLLLKRSPTLAPILGKGDPPIASIADLNIEWMNGVQFFLGEPWVDAHGQTIHADSEWALTSVSQTQFWEGVDLSEIGAGAVKGVLSVDVSDWESPATRGPRLPAMSSTRSQVREEVWEQLCDAHPELRMIPVLDWVIDPSIVFCDEHEPPQVQSLVAGLRGRQSIREFNDARDELSRSQFHVDENVEPLLVNTVNSWRSRPTVATVVPNLFLAADYVRTCTDLATMEAANEAARCAVNHILEASGSDAPPEWIVPPQEGSILTPLRSWDRARFAKGKPQARFEAAWMTLLWVTGVFLSVAGRLARVFLKRPDGQLTLGRTES